MRVRAFLACLVLTLAGVSAGCGKARPQPEASVAPATAGDTLTVEATATAEMPVSADVKPADPTFKDKINPFLTKYCNGCHNADKAAGGITLDSYQSEAHARKDRKGWLEVMKVMAAGEMPPKKAKAQPSKDERQFVLDWIDNTLTKVDCTAPKDPGRVTLRRLNRAEYNNTVRDLLGVDFTPADDFPADDVGYGFDNIGDVLSLQPVLLEKYLAAADKVVGAGLTPPGPVASARQRYNPQNIPVTPRSARSKEPVRIVFTTAGEAFLPKFHFPVEGDYTVRVRAWGTKVGGEAPRVTLRVDGKELKTAAVDADVKKPGTYEVTTRVQEGERRVAVAFTNPFTDKAAKDDNKDRRLGVVGLEIEGPTNPVVKPPSAFLKAFQAVKPAGKTGGRVAAEKVVADFARKAYRRPVRADEVARLMKLYDVAAGQGEPFEKAVALPLKAALVSPHFLFRVEEDPKSGEAVRTINDYEFATRLSYFLWSTMPDEELFRHAAAGDLRKPAVLEGQVKRMLKDPKVRGLSENFAGQWLQLRNLKTLTPDKGYFPSWDESLKAAMVREAELFFEHVVQDDRSVLEFLDADYTYLNERLATHYGVSGVSGPEFRKVKLPDARRGGVITMGSTLVVTSNPTRTSLVKRGKWVLENILGTPPPPPSPDAGELPPTAELKGTVRQQLEQHRSNAACASCHAKLDPLGFGLENFDAVGGWRTTDNKQPIDSSGVMPDGASFSGPAAMKKVLLKKADPFRRCLAEKLMTFALGRGLEYYDLCALDDVTAKLVKGQDRFSALVLAVVQSDPFQKRKGKRSD